MILAIDAGNSRLKWGLHDGDSWRTLGVVSNLTLASVENVWHTIQQPDQIVISNVAGEQVRSDILMLLSHWHLAPYWIVAKSVECGVTNGYRDPAQLGSDRWAALIAARHLYPGYCLVVSVGTAMTVDVLSDAGKFVGGIIVPGPDLMQDALSVKTDRIDSDADGVFMLLPDNTADAVYSGVLQALAGAIERMHHAVVETHGHAPLCILSGGAAHVLQPLLKMPLRVVDNLVLEGLIRIVQK